MVSSGAIATDASGKQQSSSLLANLPPSTKIRIFPTKFSDDVCQIPIAATASAPAAATTGETKFFAGLHSAEPQKETKSFNSDEKPVGTQNSRFAYDALKTKESKDQFVVRRQANGEIHIYPTKGVYAFNKRVRQERDLQLALDRIKQREQQQDRDRANWDKTRKSKPQGFDEETLDNLPGASKRPAVRTGCPEMDIENMLLSKFEDPNERVKQKFIKEDPEFKKRRKLLLDQKLKYQKIENSMPDTAGEANFLKKDDDDEFDWDGEEQDRFSDDEGNDGAEFANEGAPGEAVPEGMEDKEIEEKDEKFGKDGDEAQFDQISRLLKEDAVETAKPKTTKDDLLARELAELSAVGDETVLKATAPRAGPASAAGGGLETPSSKIDKLFAGKPQNFQVSIKEIMKAVGAKDNSHPNWHEAIKHLKQHYATQKATSGVYLFSRKAA